MIFDRNHQYECVSKRPSGLDLTIVSKKLRAAVAIWKACSDGNLACRQASLVRVVEAASTLVARIRQQTGAK